MPSFGRIAVTTVNDKGLGVFEPDLQVAPVPLEGKATLRRVFTADKVPLPGIKYNTQHELSTIANKEGAEFVVCEMPPGTISPMHATPSIDFGVIVSGEIHLILDSGEEQVLKAGDVYVQKAASHKWENRGTETVILATILVASRP
ncbi:hypothetical protein SCUCBS95973_006540 [Sporothrix curviconia]|uniref:Cupin type-2 domain-containing protein n=1 Tax=Sporothrix curviconia TaxID=1260050 RepID=A0ABP0C7A0_9PEZI